LKTLNETLVLDFRIGQDTGSGDFLCAAGGIQFADPICDRVVEGKGIAKNISEISVACFEWMAILLVPFGKKRGALKEEAKILQKIALTDELSRLW